MSILESFLILFQTNTDDVKKGSDEAARSVDGLEKKIGSADGVTEKLKGSFSSLAREALGVVAAFATANYIVSAFWRASDFAAQMNDASETLNKSVESLTLWGAAAKENGGSVEGFIGSIESLNSAMAMMDATGKSRVKPFFDQLGISMLDVHGKARPVMEMLPEIADSFSKIDKDQSNAIGRKLGLDKGLILLLQKGKSEVEDTIKRYRELGVVTKKDAEISDEFHDAQDRLAYAFNVVFTKIGTAVLPVLTKLVDALADFGGWISKHQALIFGFFGGLGVVLAAKIIPALMLLGPAIIAALPYLAVAAFAGAIALLIDDIWALCHGAPSLIGAMASKIKASFLGIGDDVRVIWAGIKQIVSEAIDFIADKVSVLRMFAPAMGPAFAGMDLAERAYSAFSSAGSIPSNMKQENQSRFLTGGAIKNSTVSIGEVNVNTQATDADGISRAIGSSLDTQMRHALNNLDDGIKG